MSSDYFPALDEKSLRFIQEMVKVNPDWLNNAPYSQDIKNFLSGRIAIADEPAEISIPTGSELINDITALREDLKSYGAGREKDSKDANTYFRLMTTLTEKLVELSERVYNVQTMQAFTELVLDTLEKKLPVDVRNEILDSLKKHLQ